MIHIFNCHILTGYGPIFIFDDIFFGLIAPFDISKALNLSRKSLEFSKLLFSNQSADN